MKRNNRIKIVKGKTYQLPEDWSLLSQNKTKKYKEATKHLDHILIRSYVLIDKGCSVEDAMNLFNSLNSLMPEYGIGESDTEVREITWCMINEYKQPGWNAELEKRINEQFARE